MPSLRQPLSVAENQRNVGLTFCLLQPHHPPPKSTPKHLDENLVDEEEEVVGAARAREHNVQLSGLNPVLIAKLFGGYL